MKHSNSCQCDMCSTDDIERAIQHAQLKKIIKIKEEELLRATSLMKLLNIPMVNSRDVSAIDFYDILMDEEKLRVLVSKLRNKAFW